MELGPCASPGQAAPGCLELNTGKVLENARRDGQTGAESRHAHRCRRRYSAPLRTTLPLCRAPRCIRGRAQPSARAKNPFNKKNDNTEIEALEWRIVAEAPPRTVLVQGTEQSETESHYGHAKLFSELPLSSRTLQGLSENKFVKMTEIQRAALPQALAGRDVLGMLHSALRDSSH